MCGKSWYITKGKAKDGKKRKSKDPNKKKKKDKGDQRDHLAAEAAVEALLAQADDAVAETLGTTETGETEEAFGAGADRATGATLEGFLANMPSPTKPPEASLKPGIPFETHGGRIPTPSPPSTPTGLDGVAAPPSPTPGEPV